MKRSKRRLTDLCITVASFTFAWLLFEFAGAWSHPHYLSQFFTFAFSGLGIERVMRAVIDLVTIAVAPIETLRRHQ